MMENKLENQLVEYCAPTLAALKSANLFRYFYKDRKHVEKEIERVNELLNQRGVFVKDLEWSAESVLIYAYRFSHLQKELNRKEVQKLLKGYGYEKFDADSCIEHLKSRLNDYTCFPHEIGVFLGYPTEDVKSFIENDGKNYKVCGLWKVYHNEKETLKLFDKLKKCKEIYIQTFRAGKSLAQMTVTA